MKPSHQEIAGQDEAVIARRVSYPEAGFPFCWHHHQEVELTYITHSHGLRYVGDSIEAYHAGDLVLLGSWLPHSWQGQGLDENKSEAVVVQFNQELLGESLLALKEMSAIQDLLTDAGKGLHIDANELSPALRHALTGLPDTHGASRLIRVLDILDRLTQTPRRTLSRQRPAYKRLERQQARIEAVCQLMHDRFQEELTQSELAASTHMSTASFSRFFKQSMGIRFQDYLNQLRIHHACQLLKTSDASISEVCFASGFGTLSNFNRRFKEQLRCTPRDFRHTQALTPCS